MEIILHESEIPPGLEEFFEPVGVSIPDTWTISTEPLKARHFAAYPSELVRRCLVTCARDVCDKCGAPHAPVVEQERVATRPGEATKIRTPNGWASGGISHDAQSWMTEAGRLEVGNRDPQRHISRTTVSGYRPTCDCQAGIAPAVILDPFLGSGTTAMVARHFGRDWVGCELNEAYAAIARERIPETPRCVLRELAKAKKKANPKRQATERVLFE